MESSHWASASPRANVVYPKNYQKYIFQVWSIGLWKAIKMKSLIPIQPPEKNREYIILLSQI